MNYPKKYAIKFTSTSEINNLISVFNFYLEKNPNNKENEAINKFIKLIKETKTKETIEIKNIENIEDLITALEFYLNDEENKTKRKNGDAEIEKISFDAIALGNRLSTFKYNTEHNIP